MKKLLAIVVLGLLLSNCADYSAEKERLKLKKEKTNLYYYTLLTMCIHLCSVSQVSNRILKLKLKL